MAHRIAMGALAIAALVSAYYMYEILSKIFSFIAKALAV